MTSAPARSLAALVLLAEPALAGPDAGPPGRLAAGEVIYLSTRLESITKSPGRKVLGSWSRGSTGIITWQERGPYVVEACTPLKVRKIAVDRALVVTRDRNGIKHTLAGDWSGSIHAEERECREASDAHPDATVLENETMRYVLPGPPIPLEQDRTGQSSPP